MDPPDGFSGVTREKPTTPPIPHVESLTNDGLLTIAFNQKMKVHEKYKHLNKEKVAFKPKKERRRNLAIETYLTSDGY